MTVAQLAIAWVASQGEDVVPVIGARRRDQLSETLGAVAVVLDDAALARIEQAFPRGAVSGARYDDDRRSALDSERG